MRYNFPLKLPLTKESLPAKIREEKLFGYIRCHLVVPEGLKCKFSILIPIFKNFNFSRADIRDDMREYATDNDLRKQLQLMVHTETKYLNG